MNDDSDAEGGNPESHKNDRNPVAATHATESRKADQFSGHKGYETAKRLAKRLRSTSKKLTISEWLTVIFTGVIAAATVWNVYVVTGQLGEMRVEQRPWLRITPKAIGNLTRSFKGLSIPVTYEIKNVGHNPAMRVKVISIIAEANVIAKPGVIKGELTESVAGVCSDNDIGMQGLSRIGDLIEWFGFGEGTDIIFPGEFDVIIADSYEVKTTIYVDTPAINKAMQSLASKPASFDKAIITSCVSYMEPNSAAIFHTGNNIVVSVTNNRSLAIDADHPIKSDDLAITRPDFGWQNYAN